MTETSPTDQREWKPKANPWLIAVVVTLGAFMEVLDTTIINVALPHIAGALGSSYDDATWALTAYLVANGVVLTISGWLSRLFGRKRYFLVCVALFTVSSFLCGLSTSLPMLIVFRLLQGFFGGGLQPSQQSIILDTFPPSQRAAAMGLAAIATVVAPVLGPLAGGYLVDNFSWHWIFYVNVPFGIITFIGVSALVEDPPWEKKRREKVDVIGISLITIGLGCLEIMCDRGEDEGWFGSGFIVTMGVLGGVGCIAAVIWLLKAKEPLLNLAIFKDRNFAVSTFLMAMVGALLYAAAIIVPQFAQQVLGYTATVSGEVLAPGGAVIICLIPLVGRAMGVIQIRTIVAFGFFFMGASLFYSARLVPTTSFAHLMEYRILQTAALAFLFVPLSTIAYATLPRELNADASAMFSMSRNYVGSLAISLSTAAVTETQQVRQGYLNHWMTPLRPEYQEYLAVAQRKSIEHGVSVAAAPEVALHQLQQTFRTQVSMLAYNQVFMEIGIIAFLVVPFCFFLAPSASTGNGKGGH
ncbi:DHA2 family efflux MFS transporter permease subunit [Acetobacter oeni]|uniref:MFS transporter n=1 Tax=Acetobacter oeni TaxID=304077 RepID=A0A511XKR9_9PROT|nr:DHA2 family efflux MFS transporter permease subunit [Acetobacter oeni]MBB3883787.1 DHA2 family multidrug resistance protein [Acetobacter oeni]NHO19868.1 DHA2 family efflux MFS transporter permease subunit [Acetobacter oeni]GBR10407.1 multidrug ABC transporter [Acetobacter oeni LMG 21952]GEN63542.1 MFS transporter [Acetobacter oeni]